MIEDLKPIPETTNMRIPLLKQAKAIQNQILKQRKKIKRDLKSLLKETQ